MGDPRSNITQTKAFGLLNSNNNYVAPEGAYLSLDNMLISKPNVIEKRFGFDSCSANLPLAKPEQLFSYGGNVFCHINEQLWFQSGDCNWEILRGMGATFLDPSAIASDADYIYVADNATIRRIRKSDQFVETIVGLPGVFGGVDGAGAAARISNVYGMVVVGSTLFFADTTNDAIRAVDLSAPFNVSTVAGVLGAVGAVDGMGSTARFDDPTGMAGPFGGFLFVTDLSNSAVRKIEISTMNVTTFAGALGVPGYVDDPVGTNARFNTPRAMGSDGSNFLYFFDGYLSNQQIRSVNVATSEVKTVGIDTDLNAINSLDIYQMTSDGVYVYYADSLNITHAIKRMKISDGSVSVFAGSLSSDGYANGYGAAARFSVIRALFIEFGTMYVTQLSCVRKIRMSDVYVDIYCGVPGVIGSADGDSGLTIIGPD